MWMGVESIEQFDDETEADFWEECLMETYFEELLREEEEDW